MKKDLIKLFTFIMFSLMVTCGSVYAGSYSSSSNVRNKTTYSNAYSGSVGNYSAGSSYVSSQLRASTSAQNISGGSKYFYIATYKFDYNTFTYTQQNTYSNVIGAGGAKSTYLVRNYKSAVIDYVHSASGYASTSSTSLKLDAYSFTGKQYY